MNPRLRVLLTILAGAAIILALLWNREVPEPEPEKPSGPSRVAPPAPEKTGDGPIVTLPVASTAARLNSPETTAEEDISTLELLLSQYRRANGGNPVGANDEITAALLGKNPKRLAFIPAENSFVDSSGRLLDRWGTPYFFHALSGSRMEVISAGPDRKLHTEDDLHGEP